MKLNRTEALGERGEHAARCADRTKLVVVTKVVVSNEDNLRTLTASKGNEAIEVAGRKNAGLAADHDVTLGERPPGGRLLVVPVEELGDRLGPMSASLRSTSAATGI